MDSSRRGIVYWLLGGGLIGSLASFLYPVIRYMRPPEVAEAAVSEAEVGTVNEFPVNSGKIVRFGSKPVLLVRLGPEDWRAFSGTCTHLDCTVQYQPERQRIWCACHNGVYDLRGRVISGPPPRPLEPFDVHLRDGEVIVAKRA